MAFNSASNFARLKFSFIRKNKIKEKNVFFLYRYKINPTIRRRTIIDERLIIIQPQIGIRAKISKKCFFLFYLMKLKY
jgi:hypothetical protein